MIRRQPLHDEVPKGERPVRLEEMPGNLACIPIVLAFWLLYLWHMVPGIYWRDSAELVVAGWGLGVTHPMGSPAYSMLAKVATLLPLGGVAFRVALASALCGCMALVVVWALARRLVARAGGGGGAGTVGALATVGVVGLGRSFWWSSEVQEVYSAQVLFVALVLWMGVRGRGEADGTRARRWWCGAGVVYGVGMGVHAFLIMYLPALLTYAWSEWRRRRWGLREAMACCVWLMLGLSVYTYLPVRSEAGVVLDWGQTARWSGFVYHVTDRKDAAEHFAVERGRLGYQVSQFGKGLGGEVSVPLGILAAAGFLLHARRSRREWLLLLLVGAVHWAFFVRTWTSGFGFLPVFLVLALWGGVGAAVAVETLRRWGVPNRRAIAWPALWIGAGLVFLGVGNLPTCSKLGYYTPYHYANTVFNSIEGNGVILGKSILFGAWYMQGVENRRPDVDVLFRNAFYQEHRFADVSAAAYPRLRYPNLTSAETPGRRMATLVLLNIAERPIYWDPEEDQKWFLTHLVPHGLLYRVTEAERQTLSTEEVTAHRRRLRHILEPEFQDERFFWDEEGQLKYALYLNFLSRSLLLYFLKKQIVSVA